MRRCWAIALLALSIASFCAQAEEPAQPVPADGKCAIPGDERWTPQEKFVWQQVCVGAEADFNKAAGYGGELDPKAPGGLPDNRILSSAFLETILLGDKYRRALTRLGVRIIGARFTETVNLDHAELGHDLWLDGSLLEKGASLVGLRSTRMLSLARSQVTGLLSMNTLQVGNLFMRNKAEFDDVDLGSAHV